MVAVAVNAVAAKHQLLNQTHSGPDAGVVKDDRVVDCSPFADVAIGANHRWANNRGAIFNASHAAHINWASDIDLIPVGRHVEAGKNPWPHFLARDLHLTHLTLQNAANRLPVIRHLADINPFKFHRQGIEGCAGLHQFGK